MTIRGSALLLALIATAVTCAGVQRQGSPVVTGLEALERDGFSPLRGKHVGLITNPTGITRNLRATVDVLAHAPGVKLVALFGPEHGVRGEARAGESVESSRDPVTGLPVYSLYGRTRRPTAAMLRGIDALVFDMQDIGSRSYTYISTMGDCMGSAAEHGIPFYVLDRPNPLGGERVEGNIVADGFRSAVSPYPIAYCHGMTVGELARMINAKGWLPGGHPCDLHVIRMSGWRRSMTWAETGLPWVLTSPHVPHADTCLFYAATGIAGELPTLSIAVGYTLPFELAGAPGVSPQAMESALERRHLPGVRFRALTWRPFYHLFAGRTCGGVQIYITDPAKVELTRLNFEILDALRSVGHGRLFGDRETDRMFDLVCGTDQVRRQFLAGRSSASMWNEWNAGATRFRKERQPYLLYE